MLLSALMACSVYEPEVFQRFVREARKNGQWHKLAALTQAHFGADLGKKASELYAQLDINIDKVQSDYEKTNWFFQLFSDLENDRNEKLETLVNNDKSLLFMAGSHLVMVSAFIEAEDAAKAISDPVKRQQMLDGLAKAWEFAKENPGAAGLEGTWAVIKGTVEDAWNVTSHTVESIAQNALGEDPLDAGLASSAALVAAIAFINPIRKATKAAKALLKRAKEARRVKTSKIAKVGTNKGRYVDILSPSSRKHILYGDGAGRGGHLWPGQAGKTIFPKSWSGDKIIHTIGDITTSPKTKWYAQTGTGGHYTKSGKPANWVTWATVDGVRIKVIYQPGPGRVVTGFPDNDPIPNLKSIP